MEEKIIQLSNDYQHAGGIHIFFNSYNTERYLDIATDYVKVGIKQDKYVMLIENERIYPLLLQKLKKALNPAQLERIHYINSFDFYLYKKNFHPSTVVDYFLQKLAPYVEKNAAICSWGHIEWNDNHKMVAIVREYEEKVEQLVNDLNIMAVCAYDGVRLPAQLKKTLLKCHNVYMTDDDLIYPIRTGTKNFTSKDA